MVFDKASQQPLAIRIALEPIVLPDGSPLSISWPASIAAASAGNLAEYDLGNTLRRRASATSSGRSRCTASRFRHPISTALITVSPTDPSRKGSVAFVIGANS